MFGRPVGFDLRMGVGVGNWWGPAIYGLDVQEPVALRIVFNSCNCPASSFIGT
jgi:hypothetical protein